MFKEILLGFGHAISAKIVRNGIQLLLLV